MTMSQVWHQSRDVKFSNNGNKVPREPLINKVVRWAGKILPRFDSVRRFTFLTGAVSLIDLAAWQGPMWTGFLVTGLSLFALDWMLSDA